MWDDQPIKRKPPPVDMPPSTRAFLSQFNRSFTPPALINDPFAVDRKLTITPLLLGSRPLYVPRNPFAVDPAVERVRHYVGSGGVTDQELRPSPVLTPELDTEWGSDDEDFAAAEKDQTSIQRDVSESKGNVNPSTGTTSTIARCTDKSLEPAETDQINQNVIIPGEYDPTSNHLSSASAAQESKWVFRTADSDLESDGDYSEKSPPQRITTPSLPYDAVFRFTTNSPTQSEGTAITSWDEWDEPSDSLGIDPITLTSNRFGTQYASLI